MFPFSFCFLFCLSLSPYVDGEERIVTQALGPILYLKSHRSVVLVRNFVNLKCFHVPVVAAVAVATLAQNRQWVRCFPKQEKGSELTFRVRRPIKRDRTINENALCR